jgi:hypothetical protein
VSSWKSALRTEEERQLAIVDRDLGDGRVDRPEPERQAGAIGDQSPAPVAQHVRGRLGAQVVDHWIAGDVGHVGLPPAPPTRATPVSSTAPSGGISCRFAYIHRTHHAATA